MQYRWACPMNIKDIAQGHYAASPFYPTFHNACEHDDIKRLDLPLSKSSKSSHNSTNKCKDFNQVLYFASSHGIKTLSSTELASECLPQTTTTMLPSRGSFQDTHSGWRVPQLYVNLYEGVSIYSVVIRHSGVRGMCQLNQHELLRTSPGSLPADWYYTS